MKCGTTSNTIRPFNFVLKSLYRLKPVRSVFVVVCGLIMALISMVMMMMMTVMVFMIPFGSSEGSGTAEHIFTFEDAHCQFVDSPTVYSLYYHYRGKALK